MEELDRNFVDKLSIYKDWLPKFYKTSNYMLLKNDGEFLSNETKTLRYPMSPVQELHKDFDVFVNDRQIIVDYDKQKDL